MVMPSLNPSDKPEKGSESRYRVTSSSNFKLNVKGHNAQRLNYNRIVNPNKREVSNGLGQTAYTDPNWWKTDYPVAYSLRHVQFMYQREGLFYRPINKIIGDCFNKWLKIYPKESVKQGLARKFVNYIIGKNKDNDNLIAEIESFNREFKVKTKSSQAYTGEWLTGLGFMLLRYDDTDDVAKKFIPTKGVKLKGIEVYSKFDMAKKPILYKDRNDKEEPHEPEFYVLLEGIQKKKVHESRVIPFLNDPLGDQYEGVAKVLPIMDMLGILRVGNFHLKWILHRRAIKQYVLYVPADLTPTDRTYLDQALTDMHDRDGIQIPIEEGSNQKDNELTTVAGSTDVIAIEPFISWFLTCYSTGIGMPKAVLTGTAAGAVTGSEVNDRQYLSNISAMQDNEIAPQLYELYKRMQDIDVLPEGDFELVFNPMYEYSQADLMEMLLRDGIRAEKLFKARKHVEFDEQGFIKNETIEDIEIEEPTEGAPQQPPQDIEDELDKAVEREIMAKIAKGVAGT